MKTKVIILAAGSGNRLIKSTSGLPKPLVDINGVSLIQRQINIFKRNDTFDIIVVRGFKPEKFQLENVSYLNDDKFDEHDQLGSLMQANSEISGNVIITFGDILFDESILRQIMKSEKEISVAIDLKWTKSYELRTDNPIELAGKVLLKNNIIKQFSENLPITKKNYDIGEFLGIIKLNSNGSKIITEQFSKLEKNHTGKFHDAKSFQTAKLTDMLQELLDKEIEINPIFVDGKWCEIDTPKDLEIAREKFLD